MYSIFLSPCIVAFSNKFCVAFCFETGLILFFGRWLDFNIRKHHHSRIEKPTAHKRKFFARYNGRDWGSNLSYSERVIICLRVERNIDSHLIWHLSARKLRSSSVLEGSSALLKLILSLRLSPALPLSSTFCPKRRSRRRILERNSVQGDLRRVWKSCCRLGRTKGRTKCWCNVAWN